MTELYRKVKCPDCYWSEYQGDEAVGMTPCDYCQSTGYIYEPIDLREICREELRQVVQQTHKQCQGRVKRNDNREAI